MRLVMSWFFSAILFFVPLYADLNLSNDSPRWGETVQVEATLDFPKDTLYPGDRVFLALNTMHQGILNIRYAGMSWDGEKFTAELTIPAGCEIANLYVLTPEKQLKFRKTIYPLNPEGNPPPGSVILSADSLTEEEWLSMAEMELEKHPDNWWAYREAWRRRIFGWHNLETEELLRQVKPLENQERSAELLRTLATGYWYAAEFETAYACLEELCGQFPSSPHALEALNEARSQVSRNNLPEVKLSIDRLIVDVIEKTPDAPTLRYHHNATAWLGLPGHSIETLKKICDPWIEEDPDNPKPHFYLGRAFTRTGQLEMAEAELTQALALTYESRPWELFLRWGRGYIHQFRSEVRIKQGRLAEALADSKLAQEYTGEHTTDDIETEASLWMKLGFPDKAEEIASVAYRKGSRTAGPLLEELYELRTGTTGGFKGWLEARLGEENGVVVDDQESEKAPEFKGKTMQGDHIDSSLLNDKLVILNFWNTLCSPCIGEMPGLNRLTEKYRDKVRFLAFSPEKEEIIRDFLKKRSFKFEIIPASGEVVKAFGISSYPAHVVISSGQIVWKGSGGSSKNLERLEVLIKRHLDGSLK